jgi:CAAX protease family protein
MIANRRMAICIEILIAFAVVVCGALKILPFGGLPILVLVAVTSVRLRGGRPADIGLEWRRLGLTLVCWSSAFGIAYQALSLLVLDPLVQDVTGVAQDISVFAGIRGNVRVLVLNLILTWTLAAFGEEFVFRGYLLNRIAQLWNASSAAFWMGIILSSALWSISHFYQGIAGVILVALHGVVFGLLYLLVGRNLWFTIFAHGVYDTTAFLLIFFGRYPSSSL